jgi:hypothetical protein
MEPRARTGFLVNALAAGGSSVIVLQIQRAEDHPQPQVSSQTVVHIYHYVASRRLHRFKVIPSGYYIKKVIPSSYRPISQSHAFCANKYSRAFRRKFNDFIHIAGSVLF